jgi:hypothetical protein
VVDVPFFSRVGKPVEKKEKPRMNRAQVDWAEGDRCVRSECRQVPEPTHVIHHSAAAVVSSVPRSSDRWPVGRPDSAVLSQQFQWFAFNGRKGWTVLIGGAVLGLAMVVMLAWLLVSLLFRWRFQFSLRSFLLLVVAFAVPAAWFAAELRRAETQRQTVAAIRAAGAWVHHDYRWDYFDDENGYGGYRFDPELPAPEWLLNWIGAAGRRRNRRTR